MYYYVRRKYSRQIKENRPNNDSRERNTNEQQKKKNTPRKTKELAQPY